MKGERSGFMFDRHWTNYDQNYHHLVQVGERKSTLSKSPQIKMGLQLDRDKTSDMKEAFLFFNKVREEKRQKSVYRQHEATMMEIKVERYLSNGSLPQQMPPELRSYAKEMLAMRGPQTGGRKLETGLV